MSSSNYATKVHEEIQHYVKTKKVEHIVSSLMEQIVKYRPNYVATFIVEHILRKHAEDIKLIWTTKLMQDLTNRMHLGASPTNYVVKNYVATASSDLQADLDAYISTHHVQQLFTELVEKMLLTEAANPYSAIVETLCEKFPDQGILAMEIHLPQKNSAKAALAKNIAAIMKAENSDEDTDEDEADDFDSSPTGKAPPLVQVATGRSSQRRFSVSSESLDPSKLREQLNQIVVVPKEPEVVQALFHIVSKSPMLRRMLDQEERAVLIKALTGPITHPDGHNVIVQGDAGDHFYLIEKGIVDVFVSRGAEGAEEKVHTYHDGDTFGQLALLYNAPRAATCRSVGEVKLWALDRLSFKAIVAGAALRKRDRHVSFLQRVPILGSLSEQERLVLADSLVEERFENNSVICQEGDPGDEFYIIGDGVAECYQKNSSGDDGERVVAMLTAGQYFGEIALLTSKPRQATVRAKGPLKVLIVDRATFSRVLGPLQDVLKRNMESYKKYTASM